MRSAYLTAMVMGLTSLGAAAATFPDAGVWQPVAINAPDGGIENLGDPLGDGSNNGRDIVGDNLRPAFFIASNATDFFFRMRLNTDPSGPGGLGSYGWGILIDSDGDIRDYDYVLMVNGTGESVDFSKKTAKTLASDPSELANVVLSSVPTVYAGGTQNIGIQAVGAGTSGFGGNEDYFLDISIPLATFYGTNPDGGAFLHFSPSTMLRFWVGVSNSSRAITLDLGGTGANPGPGTLATTASTPQLLCQSDSACGASTSGLVCASGTCISGCRGTGGNTCPSGFTCTSVTSAVGDCVSSGAPTVSTPADNSLTTSRTPLISGTSPANATITIYIDSASAGTTTASAGGTWSYAPATLADGAHSVAATSTVSTVISALSNTNVFTIDSTPPATPTVVAPPNGSAIKTATPTITGTADASTTVKIYVDGSLVGSITALNDGTFSFVVPSSLSAASHTVKATSTDAAGNVSADSNTNTFVVDLTAPATPTVATPANGSSTQDATPTYAGTAEASTTVSVYVDDALVGTTPTGGTGAWSLDALVTLTEGAHSVKVTATDAAANVSGVSDTNLFTVDLTAPGTPVVTAPANASASGDNTPTATGNAEANSTVSVYVDGSLVGTTTANGSGAWSYTSAILADGSHSVKATATDAAGNISGFSSINTFTVDTQAPAGTTVTAPANTSVTGDNTPTATGSAEANSTVSVYVDGSLVGTTTANGSGAWSYTSAVLADGSHSVKATATDAAGNISGFSNINTFTVDATPPSRPTVTAPADGSLTSDTTPAMIGTAEPDSTVAVFIDGVQVGTAVSGTGGAWSFTSPALSLGAHSVSATATDAAGNRSAISASNAFTVLPFAPAPPTLTAPVDGSLSADATPTFSGTAEAASTVTVRVDGEIVCTATATAQGTFSCTPAQGLREGAHTATASAGNVGGTSSESEPTHFILDTTAPLTPFVVGPAPGSQTTNLTPGISGRGEPGSVIAIFLDGQQAGTTTVAADGTWRFEPTTPLTLGAHQVSARATDIAGNVSLPSNTNDFSVVEPNASRPTLTSPADNASLSTAQPPFVGTAAPGASVTVLVDGVPVCSATASLAGAWTCAPSQPLSEGLHRVVAEAPNGQGGALSSETRPFTIDTVAPLAPVVTRPVDGSTSSDTTPALAGTGEPLSTVAIFVDGMQVGTVAVDVDGRWSLDSPTLTLGAHAVTATATDRAGNTSAHSSPSHFTLISPSGAPVVLSPTSGSDVADSTPLFSGTAAPGALVEVMVGGTLQCTATATASGAWSCAPTTPLAEGPHVVEVHVQGSATSTPVPFIIDTVAPSAPVVTSPTPTAYTSAVPTLAGTAEPGSRVEVKVDGVAVCVTLADAQGAWSCVPPTPLADGSHTVTATATDVAGNGSQPSMPVAFTIDLQAPGAPVLTEPAAGSSTTDTNPHFAGTAEPGSTVVVRVDGMTVCTTVADSQGAFGCNAMQALMRGSHEATATATDAAGNASPASTPRTFLVVAVTPPAPVITEPAPGAVLTDSTPLLTGTAAPGSTVTVRDSVTMDVLCVATADASGAWACESKALTDGVHSITATAELDGGISQPSAPGSFGIDTTPPTVEVEGTPVTPITSTTTTTLTWTPEPDTTYECSVDGGAFQPCSSPISLPGLEPGLHTVTVRATDLAGNTIEITTSWLVEDPKMEWRIAGGGVSCSALPSGAIVPLALLVLALRRRRQSGTSACNSSHRTINRTFLCRDSSAAEMSSPPRPSSAGAAPLAAASGC